MQKDFTHTFRIDGVELKASVSPCVWMYAGYPLQVQVIMTGGGQAFLKRQDLTWATATQDDVIALAESVRLKSCPRCGKPAFDPATVETNRAGQCETCFMSDLNAEYEKAKKKEEAAVKRRDASHKKKGFTHRVTAWVHPQAGDDYQIDIYFSAKPNKAMIQSHLKKAGSTVLDDYQAAVEL